MASKYERELKHILERRGCFVIRSAGSKSIDLVSVAVGPDVVFIEEKSTHKDRVYISNKKKQKKQYDLNRQLSKRYGMEIVYAVRYISTSKNKLWKVYEPDYQDEGYPIFRKDEGVLLNKWIEENNLEN